MSERQSGVTVTGVPERQTRRPTQPQDYMLDRPPGRGSLWYGDQLKLYPSTPAHERPDASARARQPKTHQTLIPDGYSRANIC
jgi:hypothetical protein